MIKLYQQGFSYREIAKKVRISIRDISRIIRKFTGEKNSRPEKSNTAKAFQLFLENKTLTEVTMELDIPPTEVESMYTDYLRLENRNTVTVYFEKIKHHMPDFVKYFDIMKKQEHPEKHKIKAIIDNDYVLSKQKERNRELGIENEKSLEFKVKLEMDIQRLQEQYEFYFNQNTNYNTS